MMKNNSLLTSLQNLYALAELSIQNFVQESESQEYDACTFELNNKRVIFRTAKITPTKTGLFVTCWKRSETGPIIPYDDSDIFDFFIINVQVKDSLGQFIFPKEMLLKKGIVSKHHSGGKRGFRVYLPWDKVDNTQALKTQTWQAHYFVAMQPVTDVQKISRLLK